MVTTPAPEKDAPSLYCFAVVKKESEEPWLMRVQLGKGVGIFGCNSYSLFADEAVQIGFASINFYVDAIAIGGEKAYLAAVPGSTEKVWHNTGVFTKAWQYIYQSGQYRSHDWVVKVDPDTVFLPARLQAEIQKRLPPRKMVSYTHYMSYMDPKIPLYLVNCRQWYSLQGPLEIFSKPAADKFFEGLGTCQSTLDWRQWGEDWFVSRCMDLLKVQKREGFGLLDDMYCSSPYGDTGHTYLQEIQTKGAVCDDGRPAYHAYKTVANLTRCLEQALSSDDGALRVKQ
jgi:hypothetical protein